MLTRRTLLRTLLCSAALPAAGVLPALSARAAEPSGPIPLVHAHAHNDYEHRRPLFDALDHGLCSVEADIFLVDGKLLVGHTRSELRPERTLEALYLDPLRERVRKNGGRVYRRGPQVTLLIDIKTDGEALYPTLRETLRRYSDLFTVARGEKVERKPLLAVLSGNEPRRSFLADPERYAGLDGTLADLDSGMPARTMPWISSAWSRSFAWRGQGPFPDAEREKLREIVRRAHARGYRVRFWDSPDRPEVWKEQRAAGVDLLSVDDLDGVRQFLLAERAAR